MISRSSSLLSAFSRATRRGERGDLCHTRLGTPLFHGNYLSRIRTHQSNNNGAIIHRTNVTRHTQSFEPIRQTLNRDIYKRLLSSSPPSKSSTTSQNITAQAATNAERRSNVLTKHFTTETSPKFSPSTIVTNSVESELSQLRSEIAQLSYLIKQASSQQMETQALSRRAEARAHIVENKLMDIQKHVVKIPAVLERLPNTLRQYVRDNSYISDTLRRVNESGAASILTSKYTIWLLLGSGLLFWQYRLTMYRRTSEEVANVASMTLQQESLRRSIQETLTTVANSPETLASLSALFQSLISEERTERHLIDLIVRALNSEGVRDAALRLFEVCFRDPRLQGQAGDFLKVAAEATVLDEGVQKSAAVGMQKALRNAVLPPLPWRWRNHQHEKGAGSDGSSENGGNGIQPTEPSENGHGGIEEEDRTGNGKLPEGGSGADAPL